MSDQEAERIEKLSAHLRLPVTEIARRVLLAEYELARGAVPENARGEWP